MLLVYVYIALCTLILRFNLQVLNQNKDCFPPIYIGRAPAAAEGDQ